jgi:hypothetical protein
MDIKNKLILKISNLNGINNKIITRYELNDKGFAPFTKDEVIGRLKNQAFDLIERLETLDPESYLEIESEIERETILSIQELKQCI